MGRRRGGALKQSLQISAFERRKGEGEGEEKSLSATKVEKKRKGRRKITNSKV